MIGSVIRTLCCTLLIMGIWLAGVFYFAWHINDYALDDAVDADGIVVLTGSSGRVEYGLELLAMGRGKALFISGVGPSVPLNDLINQAPASMRALLHIASGGAITLGREAENTIGNAEESAEWIKKRRFSSVLLVTADYHMPRALAEFGAYLPKDVQLIPASVRTGSYRGLGWFENAQTRNLIFAEFNKLLAAKLRHYLMSL